ncbi:hypothetical protein QQS21_007860 [Conoideocrella luteorostrata]|uniref:Uncharacterized protein n=1 Tax=Conoideocrella luteorostrata TaxID=1105319 RepID=A0AAJ0CPC5_9HYPO|nr:hypothetical protein QQS21_007860 [Conoideocrella luteorostrata]
MAMPKSSSSGRNLLNQQASVDPERLQIRIVPYSPPRLSCDGSTCSRPVSHADFSPSSSFQPHDRDFRSGYDASSSPNLRTEPCHQTPTSLDAPRNNDMHSNDAAEPVEDGSLYPDSNIDSTSLRSISASPCYRRSRRVIAVNSDKTFSLLSQAHPLEFARESPVSPRRSSTVPSSSADRNVSETFVEEQPNSPPTTLQGLSRSSSSDCSPPHNSSIAIEPSSPWNYQLVGGLRKVPDSGRKDRRDSSLTETFSTDPSLDPRYISSGSLCNRSAIAERLTPKQSFHSSQSTSTKPERSNYKTFVGEWPGSPHRQRPNTSCEMGSGKSPSSSHFNFEVIGISSSDQSLDNDSRPGSDESNRNYVLHEDLASSPPTLTASASNLKAGYSRESLLVAPLRPGKRYVPNETSLSRQRSRDSVRTGSLSSISSIVVEETARSLFSGTAAVPLPSGIIRQNLSRRSVPVRAGNRHMSSTHHQWSTALSTVVSESERGSEVPSIRLFQSTSGDIYRERSAHASNICSPPAETDWQDTDIWIDRLQPTYYRSWNQEASNSSLRLIRDQDEHGDGLAELGVLHRYPSRTRLHSYLSNFPSDRNLRSSGSSHSNSFSRAYIPTWARLYYGSGERRFLSIQHSSDSLSSDFTTSAHHSPIMSRSPSAEHFNTVIYACRQHQQSPVAPMSPKTPGAASNNSIPSRQLSLVHRIRKQTSSIWSPHLRRDKRAHIYSLWRPPSTVFAVQEGSVFKDRIQTVFFVLGFVFPFGKILCTDMPWG